MSSPARVRCPICRQESEFFAPPIGPFCSARCQLLDLGQWLNEEYKISEPLQPQHLEEYEHLTGEELDQPEPEA